MLELLARSRSERIRTTGKHTIFRLPSGEHYATPKSPSDHRSWSNSLSCLRVKLGISRRGRVAKVSEPAERYKGKRTSRTSTILETTPPPPAFDFKEKVRAAMRGEKLADSKPAAPPLQSSKKTEYKPPRRSTERAPRYGAVRVWSKNEIEAANIAMRVGKLNEYMQKHHQASQPGAITIQGEQETTMLAVEQIDATITEFETGMKVAIEEQKHEHININRLEQEIEQAKLRMQAASDKYNSLNDVKTSLGVIRSDIEKVRPMLGFLAMRPQPISSSGQRQRSATVHGLKDAIADVLSRADRPLRCSEIYKAITKIEGCQDAKIHSIYTFFSQDKKKNGSAVAVRVADNQYWRNGRQLPEQYAQQLAV